MVDRNPLIATARVLARAGQGVVGAAGSYGQGQPVRAPGLLPPELLRALVARMAATPNPVPAGAVRGGPFGAPSPGQPALLPPGLTPPVGSLTPPPAGL